MTKATRDPLGLIAVQDSVDPSISTTEGGRRMTTERARNMGYTIVDASGAAVSKAKAAPAAETPRSGIMKAKIAYAQQIEALPEARNRPSAAAGLWSSHTIESMPLAKAASFLRGLPLESAPEPKVAAQSPIDPQLMAKFRRRLDVHVGGLRVRSDQASRDKAQKIQQAISIRDRTGCSFGEAFTNVGLPARDLISYILK